MGSDGVSYSQKVRFAIDESFKGTEGKSLTVNRVHFRSSCPDTAPEFIIGEKFLVWAFNGEGGNAVVLDCTPGKRIADAAQFISELRELRDGIGEIYIFGDLYRERDLPNGVRPEDEAQYSSLPLPRTRVLASSSEGTYVASTDKNGHFVLPLPHRGSYSITADLPPYFEQAPLEFDLEDHDCADASQWTRYAFPFSGRRVDEQGAPVRGIEVELLPVATLDSSIWQSASTDRDGEYKLAASEPGDYLIAINWDDIPSDEMPYRTTLFPGVHDLGSADIVHTEEAGIVVLQDFRLPRPAECTVQVQIEDREKRPAAGAKILTKYFPAQFWHKAANAGPDGKTAVTIFGPGRTYMVASQELSADEELRSEEKVIDSCPAAPIQLIVTTPFRPADN
jgi:hypothetical protein